MHRVDEPYGKLGRMLARLAGYQDTRRTRFGMTAVIRRAEAVLQALIMMRSSMRPSLMSPGAVLCRMNTGRMRHKALGQKRAINHTIFVSDTGSIDQQMACRSDIWSVSL